MAINSFKEKIIKCKEPNQCLGDLLFIHGFCVDYSYMLAASDLAKYFNIYMINLPGHGDNTDNVRKSDMTLYSYCDYVVKYVNERNLNNFYLMGHSMGGAIASLVENKLKNRIKKLILVSPHNVAALFMGLKGLSVFYVKNMHQKYQLLDHLYKEYRCYLEDPE
jgi:pimeloyl-ACP methyl ester carboxylesterase